MKLVNLHLCVCNSELDVIDIVSPDWKKDDVLVMILWMKTRMFSAYFVGLALDF
ncbi:hypothetical protein L195_g058044 [Trifolium pratense]|uniref:Uncharacterized protein n=1 Tax=Trifolium pratense TaxID=57577 RepID=A0A2K3JPZ5_TRIPR|nr:hypothetical protein L195_g058044 [Trifolium pratense]